MIENLLIAVGLLSASLEADLRLAIGLIETERDTAIAEKEAALAALAAETVAKEAALAELATETVAKDTALAALVIETAAKDTALAELATETAAKEVVLAELAAETIAKDTALAALAAETIAKEAALAELATERTAKEQAEDRVLELENELGIELPVSIEGSYTATYTDEDGNEQTRIIRFVDNHHFLRNDGRKMPTTAVLNIANGEPVSEENMEKYSFLRDYKQTEAQAFLNKLAKDNYPYIKD